MRIGIMLAMMKGNASDASLIREIATSRQTMPVCRSVKRVISRRSTSCT
jgi:hypothetical protein